MKANCAVEVPQRLILSPVLTAGRRSESLSFEQVWDGLPDNVTPIRSLADSAYSGQPNLEVVTAHGAIPFHSIPKNARHESIPISERENMVEFATYWPNRAAKLRSLRQMVETTFSHLKELYGDRLRCRSPMGRRSEVWTKFAVLNVRTITFRQILSGEFASAPES